MKYVIDHNDLGRRAERICDARGLKKAIADLEKGGCLLHSVYRENAAGTRVRVWYLKDEEKYDDGMARLKEFVSNL